MKENSIEEDIKIIENFINWLTIDFEYDSGNEIKAIEHILSDYKKVLKENERYKKSDYETICLENNELREITDRIQSEYNDLLKDNFKLKNELETKRKEYQETYKDVREELRELRKENEELHKEIDQMKSLDIYKLVEDWETGQLIPIQKVKDKIEKYKNMCISNVKGYENYFKDNYNELVFRRMEQLEKVLKESEDNNARKRNKRTKI